jgi:predicted phosphodiesterase
MYMAAIGELWGNASAVDAAFARIEALGIQTIVNAGSSVGGGEQPNETLQRLRLFRVLSAQGRLDRLAAGFQRKKETLRAKLEPEFFAAVEQSNHRLTSANLEYLRGLPSRLFTTCEGLSVCVSHGAPAHPSMPLSIDADAAVYRRQYEFANVHIIVAGFEEQPFSREVDGTFFVSPGWLGRSSSGEPKGCFVIIDTEQRPFTARVETFSYGVSAAR